MSGTKIPESTASVDLDENFPPTLHIPELPGSSEEEEDKLLGPFDPPVGTDNNNMEQEIAPNNNVMQNPVSNQTNNPMQNQNDPLNLQGLVQALPQNINLENRNLDKANQVLNELINNSPRNFRLPADNLIARNPVNPPPPSPAIPNEIADLVVGAGNAGRGPVYAPQVRNRRPRARRPPSKVQRNQRRAGNWAGMPQNPPIPQLIAQQPIRQPDHINFAEAFAVFARANNPAPQPLYPNPYYQPAYRGRGRGNVRYNPY